MVVELLLMRIREDITTARVAKNTKNVSHISLTVSPLYFSIKKVLSSEDVLIFSKKKKNACLNR